jgi:hypothetical protein
MEGAHLLLFDTAAPVRKFTVSCTRCLNVQLGIFFKHLRYGYDLHVNYGYTIQNETVQTRIPNFFQNCGPVSKMDR